MPDWLLRDPFCSLLSFGPLRNSPNRPNLRACDADDWSLVSTTTVHLRQIVTSGASVQLKILLHSSRGYRAHMYSRAAHPLTARGGPQGPEGMSEDCALFGTYSYMPTNCSVTQKVQEASMPWADVGGRGCLLVKRRHAAAR